MQNICKGRKLAGAMLDTLEAALEPLALKTGKIFSGEVVAVLAPSHGHVPLYRLGPVGGLEGEETLMDTRNS